MVICKYCGKAYQTYKSWHRHKTLSHSNKIGIDEDRVAYEAAPKTCLCCRAPIPFSKRVSNYCSRSCAAQQTNRTRIRKKPLKVKRLRVLKSCLASCATCGSEFTKKRKKHVYCSFSCNKTKTGKVGYRIHSRFQLNKKDHPTLFNGELISRFGWYSPSNKKNNLQGVCWDHLYRIEEGYANGIDPTVMSHPANAELVPWPVNLARKTSMISYEELVNRILKWETGRRDLITFYRP